VLAGVQAAEVATRDAAGAAGDAARSAAGHLAVGFVAPMTYGVLPEALRAFRVTTPNAALDVRAMPAAEQLASLSDGTLDVGVLDVPADVGAGLATRVVARQRLVAALPTNHPLAAGRPVGAMPARADQLDALILSALADSPFILVSRAIAPALHDVIIRACRDAGFGPRVIHEVDAPHGALALVAGGLGVTLLPESFARLWHGDVVYAALRDARLCVELAAVWRAANDNPALPAFLHALGTSGGVRAN
jgi:DNA-binding transcriptional LysR family regulator